MGNAELEVKLYSELPVSKGKNRWQKAIDIAIDKLREEKNKILLGVLVLGSPLLVSCGVFGSVENPYLTATPLIINTPISEPPPPEIKLSLPPKDGKLITAENRWGQAVDKGIDIWNGETWEKRDLSDFDIFVDNKNSLIGVVNRKTGEYLVILDNSFPLKVKDPAENWPTPTPTFVPTEVPATPTSPPPTDKTPEGKPSATAVPEIIRPWPEKIGNMETDKIEIYNHGKELGVTSTNWGEITYLAKKLAEIGNIKVKGYEFHFYDSTQTSLIPADPNANYDQNINWSKTYASSTNGKKYWAVRPDGIMDVRITLPKIFETYTGAGKGYVLAQLYYDLDNTIANNLCNKGQFGINSSCDPEVQAFIMRSYHFQNYKDDLQNPAFSNLKAQFPTSKTTSMIHNDISYSPLAKRQIIELNGPKGYGKSTG